MKKKVIFLASNSDTGSNKTREEISGFFETFLCAWFGQIGGKKEFYVVLSSH